jgi:cytoskeleton protein RodZ
MESIGDKLKNQREQKGYSVEQIARDTNIAKRYLEALESEDFSVFPGDPYLIGFLRNYADYLGIDPDEMVGLYRNFQIQSQPVPMDELLVRRDWKPLIYIISAVIIIAGLGVAGYFFVPKIIDARNRRISEREALAQTEAAAGGSVYELKSEILERRFQERDIIAVLFKEERYEIVVSGIADELTLSVPAGTNVLRVGDERAIDLDGDAKMDIRVALNDIDASSGTKTAVLRFDMFVKTDLTEAETQPAEGGADFVPSVSAIGAPGLESRQVEPSVILVADEAAPFAVSIIFRGYCLFRYLIDGDDREERYFHSGDTIALDVTREVRLWISNAGSLIARVAGEEVSFGRPGEISTRVISWETDSETGENTLYMRPVY